MRIACLPGDGIGPEVMREAKRALAALGLELELRDHRFGGEAIREYGDPLPPETARACREADAVLLAAVGDPEFESADVRPEQGLIRLRRELDVYANLRPTLAAPIDLLILRELVGGLYYGPSGVREDGTVYDTCEYHPSQVERIARRAFSVAGGRSGRLTSVDKANVLATSRMWRDVVSGLAGAYPDVTLEHMLVDNAALQLVERAERFDVIVTENTFGDILSDLAAGLTGGLGVAPSASLGDGGPGLFEPVHGSAPDIAGAGVANPTAMLRSAALMLEHGLRLPSEARRLTAAIERALGEVATPDRGGRATTQEFGDAVLRALDAVS